MFKDEGGLPISNIEIQNALQEFEAKTDTAPVSGQGGGAPVVTPASSSKMVDFVINHSGGLIKSSDGANYILLAFFVIFMGLSIYLFWTSTHHSVPVIPIQNINNQTPL